MCVAMAGIGFYVVLVEFWSVACGIAWLGLVARWRGRVRRRTCLLLGPLGGFFFPFFFATLGALTFEPDFFAFMKAKFFIIAIGFGLPGLLLGLLGGWVFWRFAVRRAVPSGAELAPLFD